MEELLKEFNMKPNPSELEAARVFLEKDYSLAIERLETSPLKTLLAPTRLFTCNARSFAVHVDGPCDCIGNFVREM